MERNLRKVMIGTVKSDKMDKTVGHYAKRNKPDMERQYKDSLICEIFLKK